MVDLRAAKRRRHQAKHQNRDEHRPGNRRADFETGKALCQANAAFLELNLGVSEVAKLGDRGFAALVLQFQTFDFQFGNPRARFGNSRSQPTNLALKPRRFSLQL